MAAREAANTELTTAIAGLPWLDEFRRALTLDWIRSSKDGWDTGSEAGIIWAYVSYPNISLPGQAPQFRLNRAQIDDVSRPEGVITSLKDIYGEDTPLELLPIEMVVHVDVTTTDQGLQIAQFVNPHVKSPNPTDPVNLSAKPTDLRDAPSWTFLSGDETFAELWNERRLIPTVGELSAGRFRGWQARRSLSPRSEDRLCLGWDRAGMAIARPAAEAQDVGIGGGSLQSAMPAGRPTDEVVIHMAPDLPWGVALYTGRDDQPVEPGARLA
jgi:hypothetical protein